MEKQRVSVDQIPKDAEDEDNNDYNDNGRSNQQCEYFLVVNQDGNMFCSCGRSLNKLDDGTYRCSAGWPIYRPDQGEVMIDKFGNLMLKVMPHAQGNQADHIEGEGL